VSTLAVHHFGPDPNTVGGMASVIRTLTEHNVGGESVYSHATWRPRSPLPTTVLFAASVRALLRIPSGQVAHVHLSERGSFLREGSLVALAHRRDLVTVATIHGASFVPFACQHPRLVSAVLRRTHLITCLEQESLELVRRSAPKTRSEIVANPVVVDVSAPTADETEELVLFAGEISRRKGADVLQRAWQLVAERRPSARCVMVGPVADFEPSRIERLDVRTPVAPAELKTLLQSARVIALPSRAEGMPMILAEAMSVGRPFVSTPVGGIPELGAGGMLVAVGDELGLADRLTELLATPDLAQAIGERGQRFCAKTRSTDVIDVLLRRLYAAAGDARRAR
jgi:glycosyltransferase involved in cell wall biosynthesis